MRPLFLRFRRDITCAATDCGKLACTEGETIPAILADGSPISLPSFDTLAPHRFEVTCTAGHVIALHFPKDVMVVKTADVNSDRVSPAVLRS